MLNIRKAKQGDIDVIYFLFRELIEFHGRFDSRYKTAKNAQKGFSKFISSQITSRKSLVLVAVKDRRIVGYLYGRISQRPPLFEHPKFGVIHDLAVTSTHRRTGLGSKLYKESLEWFRHMRIDRIELGVATANPVSNAFWREMGYEPCYNTLFKIIS